jgi:hypothetical protein
MTETPTVYRSVTVSAPSAGLILASATGTIGFIDNEAVVVCSITQGTTIDLAFQAFLGWKFVVPNTYQSLSTSRTFVVPEGDAVINLVCQESGPSDNAIISDSSLTAIFVPNRY